MYKSNKLVFGLICFILAATMLMSGCQHPWRLAINPNTAVPTLEPEDSVTPDESGEPQLSDEPIEDATDLPITDTDSPDDTLPPEEPTDTPDDTKEPQVSGSATEAPKPTDSETEKPTATPKATDTPKPTATPKPTPEPDIKPFSTTAINDNNTYDNSMFSSNGTKLTMINIWSTTCGPCIQELPHLPQLQQKYQAKGVKIVTALGDSETPGAIKTALDIINGMGFSLPVLRCNSSFNAQFPAGAYPTTYFIDQYGNIVKTVTTANTYEKWCDIIDDLL